MINPCDVKRKADEVLEEWDDTCNELNVPHFVYLGTCLGFYRDKGYIKGDNDIDVGVLCDIARLAEKLLENGFTTEEKHKKHFFKHGILLDVWSSFSDKQFLVSFDEVTYNGRIYNVPHPVEKYLEHEYGDWREPSVKER